MRLINLDVEINRVCNEICGCNREHCKWKVYGEDEGCNQIQELEKARVVEAIPVEWLRKWPKDLREGAYVRDILQDWQKEQEVR